MHRTPVEQNLTRVGDDRAGQRLDERRFARSVVADDSENFRRAQLEIGAVEGDDVPVALRQALRLENDGATVRGRHV